MKKLTKPIVAAAAALAFSASVATAGGDTAGNGADRASIETVLSTYETALNTANTDTVMTLYTDDGVFMPQNSTPIVGAEAVRAAYDGVFQAIKLDISFTIDEVIQVAPKWAFARTRSEGVVTVNATGDKVPEANQELFVFQKQEDGNWRIARYIFSTTNPARR